MVRKPVVTAVVALLAGAVPALASPAAAGPALTLKLSPTAITWGDSSDLAGVLTVGGTPREGAKVNVQSAPLPAGRPLTGEAISDTTGTDGSYGFTSQRPNRSFRFRAMTADPAAVSPVRTLYVVPRKILKATNLRDRRVRIAVTALVPRGVKLSGRALFYLAPASASRIPYVGRARMRPAGFTTLRGTKKTRADRFRAVLTVHLPRTVKGSYRYAYCYDAPRATGMDDTRSTCSRRALKNTFGYRATGGASESETALSFSFR